MELPQVIVDRIEVEAYTFASERNTYGDDDVCYKAGAIIEATRALILVKALEKIIRSLQCVKMDMVGADIINQAETALIEYEK